MDGTWTAQACQLADALPEWGMAAAGLNSAAWNARIAPEATRGLIGAAEALTGGRAAAALWAKGERCPDAATFLARAAELEIGAAEMLARASAFAAACRDARDAAVSEYQAASAIAGADTPAGRGADRMERARRVIADCDAALEITDDAGTRLAHARTCLMRVPDDYAEAYAVPAGLVRQGLQLPHDGDFLAGTAA